MNPEEKFFETLKTLGFPRVHKYSAANFESYFVDSQLCPLLEYFCTFNKDNVLTSEELEEYASITPEEMMKLEELACSESELLKDEKEKEEEAEFLRERLNLLERKYNSLEEQKRILLEHEALIIKEKVSCEEINKSLRRIFDDFSVNKVPQGIAQLSATLQSISELISKFKDVADVGVDKNYLLPFLNAKDVEEYFREEERLSNLVLNNLVNEFQFEDEGRTRLSIPGLSKQEISKEIHIVRKVLKSSKMCEFKSVCNKIKAETITLFVNKYQSGYFDDVFEMSIAQLSNKLGDAIELNKSLNKKEALMMSHLSNAVVEHVDEQCRKISIAHSNEIQQIYQSSLKTILQPLQYLLNQKARLELLNLLVRIHERHWKDVKALLEKVFHFTDSEKESCLLRQQKIEESMKQAEVEETHLDPDSIFFSVYKILNSNIENDEQCLVTLSDVIKVIEELSERKKLLLKIEKENIDVLKTMEKQYCDMEEGMLKGIDFDEAMWEERKFSTEVNQVEVMLADISSILKEYENDWQQKKKLLECERNVKMARDLFIIALLERETFEKIIENLGEARQHLL